MSKEQNWLSSILLLIIVFAVNPVRTFGQRADYTRTYINKGADFRNTKFDSLADFWYAQFDSIADFGAVQFNATVDFSYAKFNSDARLSANFTSEVIFWNTVFQSEASFENAQFESNADFRFAQFRNGVSFNSAVLPDYIDFRYVTIIASGIDFTNALSRKSKCNIALYGSNISKIKINLELFELWFPYPDTTYQQKTSVYEKVLKKFDDEGFLRNYEVLDIEYRTYKYLQSGDLFLNWFQRVWWNYGYNKELVFLWTLKFFVFFTIINLFLFTSLMTNVYNVDFLPTRVFLFHFTSTAKNKNTMFKNVFSDESFRFLSNIVIGLKHLPNHILNSLIYTALVFFGLKMDMNKFVKIESTQSWNNYVLLIYLLVIYVSGLFCLGYIANIVFAK